jgi:hypothetical protein
MENIIKQLTSSSYWTLNKDLCKKIGLQNTLLLQHFIDLQYKLFGGKEFYQQQERLQEELGLTEWAVKQSINYLLKNEIITVEKKGIPAKNYYLISEERINLLLSGNTSDQLGENHLTGELESTQQRKELNKKELNKKELNKKEDWDVVVSLFPDVKRKGAGDAQLVWDFLSNEEKKSVLNHLKIYLQNTEERYIKQICNYFNDKMWNIPDPKQSKSKKNKHTDLGMIEWFQQTNNIKLFDVARTELAKIKYLQPNEFEKLESEYESLLNEM